MSLPDYHLPKDKVLFSFNKKKRYKSYICKLFSTQFDITNTDAIKEIVNDFITVSNKELRTIIEVEVDYTELVVVGDFHGNIFDIQKTFIINGETDWANLNKTYVLNGDFIDRGGYSFECALVLFLLKIFNPSKIFLLRGNHEYGFCAGFDWKTNYLFRELRDRIAIAKEGLVGRRGIQDKSFFVVSTEELELRSNIIEEKKDQLSKFNKNKDFVEIVDMFKTAFQYLPCAALITMNIDVGFDEVGFSMFAVHGGLSKMYSKITDINTMIPKDILRLYDIGRTKYLNPKLNLKVKPTDQLRTADNVISDLIYRDASDEDGFRRPGPPRRPSFGPDITEQFLNINHIGYMFRGHQPTMTKYFTSEEKKTAVLLGYRIHKKHNNKLITIHSNSMFWKNSKFKDRYASFVVVKECGDMIIYSFNTNHVISKNVINILGNKMRCTEDVQKYENFPALSKMIQFYSKRGEDVKALYLCKKQFDVANGVKIDLKSVVRNVKRNAKVVKKEALEYEKIISCI